MVSYPDLYIQRITLVVPCICIYPVIKIAKKDGVKRKNEDDMS